MLHEPFSHAYYHGLERQSDRFEAVEPRPEHAYDAVMGETLAARETPIVFMKDMVYQARPIEDSRFFAEFTNTFLIREPEEALLSLHRMWPDFTFEEAGYALQAQLFELVTDTLAQPAVVVDATDFRRYPERTMAAYCAAVGIEHREDALSWEAGAVPEWQGWAEWHRDAGRAAAFCLLRTAQPTSCRRACRPWRSCAGRITGACTPSA